MLYEAPAQCGVALYIDDVNGLETRIVPPTDSASRNQVCKTLTNYQDTLIIVSHDTDCVETLEPDLALPLAQDHVRYFDQSHLAIISKT